MELLNLIHSISEKRQYWFVRTDGGKYYENYLAGNFVAIGWNYLSVVDFNNISKTKDAVKNKIALYEKLDLGVSKDKKAATLIYNKSKTFIEDVRKDDVIVIPNENSKYLSIGIVTEEFVYVSQPDELCKYVKRRKIQWLKKDVTLRFLNPYLFSIKSSHHSISSARSYADYIDMELFSLYEKNNKTNLVLRINTQDPINAKEFFQFGQDLMELLDKINKQCGYNEDLSDLSITLDLQSPGNEKFVSQAKKCLVTLGLIITITACKSIDTIDPNEYKGVKSLTETFNEISTAVDSLKVAPLDEYNKIVNVNK